MNYRRLALTIGVSLILMTIAAGFSIGYAISEFYQLEQLELLKNNILSNQELYRNMLFGIGVILILDLLVSYTLFEYFKNDNKKISILAGIIRVIYTLIFGIATYYLVKNLNINELSNQTIVSNFQQFYFIWNVGLMIFGFHVLLIGWLMKLHQRIPKILWYVTVFAGVCYIAVHLLKLTSPHTSFTTNLEMFLSLPMAVGELGLAIWLLVKGGKEIGFVKELHTQ